jgi:phosphoribosylpyrophosphate synthetase
MVGMDSLHSILSDKNFDEPPEMSSIKKYVEEEFKVAVSVMVRDKDIVIGVPNAALANTLRLRGPDIKRRCQINKRLTFRIG